MSTPADDPSPGASDEVTRRRDRMQAIIDELQRVAGSDDGGDGRWREFAVAAIAEAATTWERHVAGTEAPQGILADVLKREPRLAHLVSTLRTDHTEVRALLDRARAVLPTQDPSRARNDLQVVAERLARHHHLGAELIYSTYGLDLGGSG